MKKKNAPKVVGTVPTGTLRLRVLHSQKLKRSSLFNKPLTQRPFSVLEGITGNSAIRSIK